MPAGSTVTIVFKVKTDPGLKDGENLNNCARITAPIVSSDPLAAVETDPNGGNNESCDSTVVRTQADLGIYKSAAPKTPVAGSNPPAVKAGENIVYTLEFGNAGPSNAQNVRITDLIPGNTSYVTPVTPFTILASGGLYTGANSVNISCDRVPAGSNNLVCVPKNNSSLTPTLADGELPAGVQSVIVYEVKVNESVTGGTIIANAAKITSADGGTQPSTPDPNPGNNTSLTTSTPVIAASQLAVSKVVKSSTAAVDPGAPAGAVIPGTFLTYEITVRNNGPSDVSNLRVIDTLPLINPDSVGRATGAKYISMTQTAGFGTTFTCAPPTGVNPSNNPQGNGGSLQCTAPLMSANAPNNEAKLEVVVFIDPATKSALVNKVDANATINNFNQPVSSSATLTTPVSPTSDLALTKTHAPDPVIAGTEFEYTITLTNNGQSTAQMASVVDELPPYQSIVSTQITQTPDGNGAPAFTCTPSFIAAPAPGHERLTCAAAELPPNKRQDGTVNQSGTVTFKIRVKQSSLTPQPTPTAYQNCVTAASMSFDPNTANSTNVCDTVNIIFRGDLTAGKVDTPDPVIAGELLTYTITAGNLGPSGALNFTITDPLPGNVSFVSATAPGSTTLTTPAVGATGGVVTAVWAGLTDAGVSRSVTIVVRVCSESLCDTVISNTATASSDTPDAVLTNNNNTAETTVKAKSDLSLVKSGPSQAQFSVTGGPSNVTYTLSFANAGPSNSAGTKIVDVLPKGFEVVGQPASTVPGTTFDITTVDGVAMVTANLGVLGAANQCATTRPLSGTVTIVARVPIKHPIVAVTNTATISTTNCLADPNLGNNTSSATTSIVAPGGDPGISYPALSEVTDTKAGSILFFPIYTSDAVNTNNQNTRISITNVSSTERAYIHLFAVDGSTCAVLDAFLCLTPNQTTSFLASDFDPGASGYLMAVAVDGQNGLPTAFNCLIGDEYVKFSSGHQANLGAEAIAASMMFPGGVNPNVTTTQLKFDGSNYNRLPRILALDNIASPNDGNSTLLIVNRAGGNFTTGGAGVGAINGLLFDDAEVAYSFTAAPGSCQFRTTLSNGFPRTFTPFSRLIPSGRSGWMKFWTVEDRGLFGAAINFNPSASASSGAFNQGHNLHHMTLTDAVTITVPVFIPSC